MQDIDQILKECSLQAAEENQQKKDQADSFKAETISGPQKKEKVKPKPEMTNDRYYDFSHRKRGVALIFNHIHFKKDPMLQRKGTQKDCESLIKVLKKYGFDVRDYHDQPESQIKNIVLKVSEEDHSEHDCFMCVVMTHGESDGYLLAYDKKYQAKNLWENFVGTNCDTLIGKPKLFFIQACRGELADPGVKYEQLRESDATDATGFVQEKIQKIPTMADILIMYSTSEGYYSFRNEECGSWFIQSLVKELDENEFDDLMTILLAVNRRVAFEYISRTSNIRYDACKQMPNILCMLTKTLYFTKKIPK